METTTGVRIDKWLWAVRVFKTRSQASAACRAGHIRIGDHPVKPSREVRPGETITAQVGVVTRTLKVVALLENRVGPKLVSQYLEDLTPPSEYEKRREPQLQPLFTRPKGMGRPTKKQRRAINPFLS